MFIGDPPCVSNIAVRLEVGQPPVNARLWILKIHYWLKLIFSPAGLAPLTLLDTFHSTWKASLFEKIRSLGFSPQILIAAGYERARSQVLQRIRDIELQCHMGKMDKHATIRDFGRGFSPANYLADLQIPKYRHSFTLARFNVLPSALLLGRYEGKPYESRVCPCGSSEVETSLHVLLHCSYYEDLRLTFIAPVLQKLKNEPELQRMRALVEDKVPEITINVAKFCVAAIRRRKQELSNVNMQAKANT